MSGGGGDHHSSGLFIACQPTTAWPWQEDYDKFNGPYVQRYKDAGAKLNKELLEKQQLAQQQAHQFQRQQHGLYPQNQQLQTQNSMPHGRMPYPPQAHHPSGQPRMITNGSARMPYQPQSQHFEQPPRLYSLSSMGSAHSQLPLYNSQKHRPTSKQSSSVDMYTHMPPSHLPSAHHPSAQAWSAWEPYPKAFP